MKKEELIKKYDLVDLINDDRFIKDIMYATENNFTGKVLYRNPICLLRRGTYEKLLKANNEFNNLGYKILIWDAYRPISIQEEMWNILPDERYVSNPLKNKSMHCKGSAVDITLVKDGNIIDMPTEFDSFSEKCHLSYFDKLDKNMYNNVTLLHSVMKKNGFNSFETEWWHFTDSDDYEYIEDDLEWKK